MRFIILSFLAFVSISSYAQQNADDAAILQSIEYMEEGWSKKDGILFAKGFAEDADYVVINGMHIKSREVIASAHQHIFNTIYRETEVTVDLQKIRYIRPDVAVAHVKAQMTGNSNGKKIDHAAQITVVLEKKENYWQIIAFQNTEIEASSKDED